MNNSEFKNAIINHNKYELSKIPKVDIHNHAVYSSDRLYLVNHGVNLPNIKINNIESLIFYSRDYIQPIQYEKDGLKLLLEGNFENCIKTGVSVVETEIDYKNCIKIFNSNVNDFIDFLKSFKYDNLLIFWDLGISRDSYKEEYKSIILELLNTEYFKGIDLTSTENIKPNSIFKDFYTLANSLHMITKVHAGEQLGADYVRDCIIDFNPVQIQHGISIVEDKEVMQLAKDKNIIFNVCPTSNVILGYAKSIKEHPIKKMVEFGLNITIATDDLLFFENDINDEYIKLYQEGTLTLEQLEKIKDYGIKLFNN